MSWLLRTGSGRSAKHLFHPSTVLVWVEGDEDLSAYRWIIHGLECRLESAGGKQECLRLATEMIQEDSRFVVVVDGDYEVLRKRRSTHRRLILLHRYAIENYLLELDAIERVCDSLHPAIDADASVRIASALDHVEGELEHAIVLDAAAMHVGLDRSPLPSRIERLLISKSGYRLDPDKITRCCMEVDAEIPAAVVEEVLGLICTWKKARQIAYLLRGHLAFGVVRRIVETEIRARGKRLHMDNRGLLALLSGEVWNGPLQDDHRSLRRRLRRAVNEVARTP